MPLAGYRSEPKVQPGSATETYIALRLLIDNWRFAGVPFYLRTGKRLPARVSEIAIQFNRPPLHLFQQAGVGRQRGAEHQDRCADARLPQDEQGKTGDITSAPGYGPSKAGVDALTKTLARQLAHYGINVNGVAPHAIETEMSAEWSPEKRKAIIEAIPLKRLGRPEDVAEAVLFLASDKAAFITGEILDVNGGFIMD